MELFTRNKHEVTGLFSKRVWILAVGTILIATAAVLIFSPASAASNATLFYTGNLQEQISVSTTGNATEFSLNLGDNQFNNRSLVYSCNIPIRFQVSDQSPGKPANATGFFSQYDGMGYLTTKLGSPFTVQLANGTPVNVTGGVRDINGPINPVVGASQPIFVNQYIDFSDPVALGTNRYKTGIQFAAVVI